MLRGKMKAYLSPDIKAEALRSPYSSEVGVRQVTQPVPSYPLELKLPAPELPHSVHYLLLQDTVLNLMSEIYTSKHLGQKCVNSLLAMQITKKMAKNSKCYSCKQEEWVSRFFKIIQLS